jgi:hypothetical protein
MSRRRRSVERASYQKARPIPAQVDPNHPTLFGPPPPPPPISTPAHHLPTTTPSHPHGSAGRCFVEVGPPLANIERKTSVPAGHASFVERASPHGPPDRAGNGSRTMIQSSPPHLIAVLPRNGGSGAPGAFAAWSRPLRCGIDPYDRSTQRADPEPIAGGGATLLECAEVGRAGRGQRSRRPRQSVSLALAAQT